MPTSVADAIEEHFFFRQRDFDILGSGPSMS